MNSGNTSSPRRLRSRSRAALRAAAAAVPRQPPPARWSDGEHHEVNPTLQVLPLSWRAPRPARRDSTSPRKARRSPSRAKKSSCSGSPPGTGGSIARAAGTDDLLALKLVVEAIARTRLPPPGPLSVGAIENVLAARGRQRDHPGAASAHPSRGRLSPRRGDRRILLHVRRIHAAVAPDAGLRSALPSLLRPQRACGRPAGGRPAGPRRPAGLLPGAARERFTSRSAAATRCCTRTSPRSIAPRPSATSASAFSATRRRAPGSRS